MKKRRRVELHIEHREISVSIGPGVELPPVRAGVAGESVSQLCPACGSADVMQLAKVVASPEIDLADLQRGIEAGSVHIYRSPEGDWLICRQSFQHS